MLQVKGIDGRDGPESIAYHIRECERIQATGLDLDVVYKYPSSKMCRANDREYIDPTPEDDCHYVGFRLFQTTVEAIQKRAAIQAAKLNQERL